MAVTEPPKDPDDLSWAEQADRIRRMTAKWIDTISDRLDADQYSDEDLNALSKLSAIAKSWAVEDRQSKKDGDGEDGDGDAKTADDVTLMRKVPHGI